VAAMTTKEMLDLPALQFLEEVEKMIRRFR